MVSSMFSEKNTCRKKSTVSVIKQHCFKTEPVNTSNTSSTSIETYAINKLQAIFHEFKYQSK